MPLLNLILNYFNAFFHEMLSQGIYLGPSPSKRDSSPLSTAKQKLIEQYRQPICFCDVSARLGLLFIEQKQKDFEMFDLIGIGNAIVDTDVEIDEVFLENESLPKGQMTLIDSNRMAELSGA